jgi:hypothetical protein
MKPELLGYDVKLFNPKRWSLNISTQEMPIYNTSSWPLSRANPKNARQSPAETNYNLTLQVVVCYTEQPQPPGKE